MPSHRVYSRREIADAVIAGEAFLLERQDSGGLWQDYELEVGRSEAWSTAWVAWTLAQPPIQSAALPALLCAADGLHRLRQAAGWGYNRRTAVDADSTGWVWRVLALLDENRGVPALPQLQAFLGSQGAARTFVHEDRFGAWSGYHADVTPLVGLAIVAVGAELKLLSLVRQAVLAARIDGAGWATYWWSTDAYVNATCLEYLTTTGSIPSQVVRDMRMWLLKAAPSCSAFETAFRLGTAMRVLPTEDFLVGQLLTQLIESRQHNGAWPASTVLLVPAQFETKRTAAASTTLAHPDDRQLMTTAAVIRTLKQWLLIHNQ